MFFFVFLRRYLSWHYAPALVGYIRVSRNFWWYFFHLFSISQLSATLFSPYKRIVEYPHKYFSLEKILERLILNLFSRVVGFIIRFVIIVTGFLTLTIFTTVSLAGFALWLGAPILIPFGIVTGVWLLTI